MAATWRHGENSHRPDAVGILALEVYFPTQYVLMSEMEGADGCLGKYTQGLGQEAMSYSSDREDSVSMALSVTQLLLEKYGVLPEEVGHVQVATESGVDRSKSIKSHLMVLFAQQTSKSQQQQQGELQLRKGSCSSSSSNRNGCQRRVGVGPPAEGVDCMHACYGGTAALLAASAWVESRRWDGRLALVVAADVALYAPGTAARPTGGCGAAAFLVGPDAPLVLDPLWYGSHAEHSWDFFKPLGALPYPAVNGQESLKQYLSSAGRCALAVAERLVAAERLAPDQGLLSEVQHYVAHAPFNKLARKGLARIALMDALRRAHVQSELEAAVEQGQAGGSAAAGRVAAFDSGTDVTSVPAPPLASGQRPLRPPQSGDGGTGAAEGKCSELAAGWVCEWVQQESTVVDGGGCGGWQRQGLDLAPEGVLEGSIKDSLVADGTTVKREMSGDAGGMQAAAAMTSAAVDISSSEQCFSKSNVCKSEIAVEDAEVGPDGLGPASTAAAGMCFLDVELARLARMGVEAGLSYESYATWQLDDKALEAQMLRSTAATWSEKAEDGAWLQKQLGNSYTACAWQGVASLVWRHGELLAGRRVMIFSFGSGTIASLISLVGRGGSSGSVTSSVAHDQGGDDTPSDPRFTLAAMQQALDLDQRLLGRVRQSMAVFDAVSVQVEASYACPVPFEPRGDVGHVVVGSYYLARVDEQSRRWYERKT